jgi:uncharacterized membrane protein YphA (DoxX/SURF4 family)
MYTKNKTLHISLWVVQCLLAAAFGLAGIMKITSPMEKLLEAGMTFVSSYEVATVRFIGWSELLGALGLILPSALRIKPILTSVTAFHMMNNEPYIATIVFFVLCLFVSWGRYKKAAIFAK